MQLENQGRELAGRETLRATICCCPEQLVWLAVGAENTAKASTRLPQDTRSQELAWESLSYICQGCMKLLPGNGLKVMPG